MSTMGIVGYFIAGGIVCFSLLVWWLVRWSKRLDPQTPALPFTLHDQARVLIFLLVITLPLLAISAAIALFLLRQAENFIQWVPGLMVATFPAMLAYISWKLGKRLWFIRSRPICRITEEGIEAVGYKGVPAADDPDDPGTFQVHRWADILDIAHTEDFISYEVGLPTYRFVLTYQVAPENKYIQLPRIFGGMRHMVVQHKQLLEIAKQYGNPELKQNASMMYR